MNPAAIHLLEPLVGAVALMATLGGLKVLIWGKGPIRRASRLLEDRLARLEEREEVSLDRIDELTRRLADIQERLDFTDRLLSRSGGGAIADDGCGSGIPRE